MVPCEVPCEVPCDVPCDVRGEGELGGEVAAEAPSDDPPDAGLADMDVGLVGTSEVGVRDREDRAGEETLLSASTRMAAF